MHEAPGVAAGLVRLSFLVQSVYAEVCSEHGLTPPQAQLLCVTWESPRRMSELAPMMRLEKSSLSGLVDRVERKGWVRRVASTKDGRGVTVELTAGGRRLAEEFHARTTERLTEMVACLPAQARQQLAAIADRIVSEHAVPAVFQDAPHVHQ